MPIMAMMTTITIRSQQPAELSDGLGGGSDNFVMSSSDLTPPYMANISFHIAVSPKILTGGQIIVQTSRIFSLLCPNRYGCVWCRPFSP